MHNFLVEFFNAVRVDRVRLGLVECVTDRCRKEGMLLFKRTNRPLDRTLRPERKLIAPLFDCVVNPAASVLIAEARFAADPVLQLLKKYSLIQTNENGEIRLNGKRGFLNQKT